MDVCTVGGCGGLESAGDRALAVVGGLRIPSMVVSSCKREYLKKGNERWKNEIFYINF